MTLFLHYSVICGTPIKTSVSKNPNALHFQITKTMLVQYQQILIQQDNVHTNMESVQCISIVYSICPHEYNQ